MNHCQKANIIQCPNNYQVYISKRENHFVNENESVYTMETHHIAPRIPPTKCDVFEVDRICSVKQLHKLFDVFDAFRYKLF